MTSACIHCINNKYLDNPHIVDLIVYGRFGWATLRKVLSTRKILVL